MNIHRQRSQTKSQNKISPANETDPVKNFTQAGFSTNQIRKLNGSLDKGRIHTREIDGRQLSYIEGWFAVDQANEIFGYAGWDREMVHFERVVEKSRGETATCGYIARVRVRVRAGQTEILREGSGWGFACAKTLAAAHERALKSAETDATKRALSTFGARFGLKLYDKEQNGAANASASLLTLFAPDGSVLADNLTPPAYCSGLRQLIDTCRTYADIDNLAQNSASCISNLCSLAPTLRNTQGVHYSELLLRLFERARGRLAPHDLGSHSFQTLAEVLNPRLHIEDEEFYVSNPPSAVEVMSSPDAPSPPTAAEDAKSVALSLQNVDNENNPDLGIVSIEVFGERIDVLCGSPAGIPPSKSEQLTLARNGVAENQRNVLSESSNKLSGGQKVSGDRASLTVAQQGHDNNDYLLPSKITSGKRVDKSRLVLGHERRLRDKNHLKQIRQLPCVICDRQPSHAHHIRFAQNRGLSQKVSDEFVVPVCALHHGELHRDDSERGWWIKQGLDPLPIAADLWDKRLRDKG